MTKVWGVINLQIHCKEKGNSGGETNMPCACWGEALFQAVSSQVNSFVWSTAIEECLSMRVKFTLTHKHEDNCSTFSVKDFVLLALTTYPSRSDRMSTIQQIFNQQREIHFWL